jgi:glycosyltransferase involved in cell wall biosynthesis
MSAAERVRVLVLIKGLGLGGAERLLERSIPHLDRERFDYQLAYLLPWKDALATPFRAAGIPVHCLNYRRAADVGVVGRLAALLRRERIELVHAHLPVPGVLARLARRRGAVRYVVYTEHSAPSHHRALSRALNAATYRMNDAVIAVSDGIARQVARYLRGGRNGTGRLFTIPNAVDVEELERVPLAREAVRREFGFPDDARLVVHIGNLRPVKGHADLLAAARRVVDRDPLARFLLVGTGPLAARLAAEAARLGLDGRVVFAGFREDATRLLAAADLYVLASLQEGMPVSLLEAMALGRPAVLTRVGSIPEVAVDGETACLVAPRDPAGLADAMVELLGDPPRRARMGEAARERARRRYGMAQMVAAVEDVYRQVVAA